MEHWHENKFEGFEDRMKSEDNKGTVYDSENLNELTSWKSEGMKFHASEV